MDMVDMYNVDTRDGFLVDTNMADNHIALVIAPLDAVFFGSFDL
jgi:hypothetical protein